MSEEYEAINLAMGILNKKISELEKKFEGLEQRYETKRDTIFKLETVQGEQIAELKKLWKPSIGLENSIMWQKVDQLQKQLRELKDWKNKQEILDKAMRIDIHKNIPELVKAMKEQLGINELKEQIDIMHNNFKIRARAKWARMDNLEEDLREFINTEIYTLKTQKETQNFTDQSISIINNTLYRLEGLLEKLDGKMEDGTYMFLNSPDMKIETEKKEPKCPSCGGILNFQEDGRWFVCANCKECFAETDYRLQASGGVFKEGEEENCNKCELKDTKECAVCLQIKGSPYNKFKEKPPEPKPKYLNSYTCNDCQEMICNLCYNIRDQLLCAVCMPFKNFKYEPREESKCDKCGGYLFSGFKGESREDDGLVNTSKPLYPDPNTIEVKREDLQYLIQIIDDGDLDNRYPKTWDRYQKIKEAYGIE